MANPTLSNSITLAETYSALSILDNGPSFRARALVQQHRRCGAGVFHCCNTPPRKHGNSDDRVGFPLAICFVSAASQDTTAATPTLAEAVSGVRDPVAASLGAEPATTVTPLHAFSKFRAPHSHITNPRPPGLRTARDDCVPPRCLQWIMLDPQAAPFGAFPAGNLRVQCKVVDRPCSSSASLIVSPPTPVSVGRPAVVDPVVDTDSTPTTLGTTSSRKPLGICGIEFEACSADEECAECLRIDESTTCRRDTLVDALHCAEMSEVICCVFENNAGCMDSSRLRAAVGRFYGCFSWVIGAYCVKIVH